MLENLRQIAVFAKTVEHGSFKKAASALRLSPSVVSHHVSQLEQQLGVALLYRSTRRLTLTSDGQRLLDSAQEMVSAAESFVNLASNQSPELFGQLDITLPAFMEQSALVDHIGDFAKTHPRVSINLDCSDAQREIIRDGIDLAIRMGRLVSSSLKARRLGRIDRGVYGSVELARTLTKLRAPQDLERMTWVGLSQVGSRYGFTHTNGRQQAVNSRAQLVVTNVLAVQQLISNGNGIGVLPQFLANREGHRRGLVQLLPSWKLKPIDVYAVWPGNAPRDGLTRRLIQFLVDRDVLI